MQRQHRRDSRSRRRPLPAGPGAAQACCVTATCRAAGTAHGLAGVLAQLPVPTLGPVLPPAEGPPAYSGPLNTSLSRQYPKVGTSTQGAWSGRHITAWERGLNPPSPPGPVRMGSPTLAMGNLQWQAQPVTQRTGPGTGFLTRQGSQLPQAAGDSCPWATAPGLSGIWPTARE